jgi:hypothetical protein
VPSLELDPACGCACRVSRVQSRPMLRTLRGRLGTVLLALVLAVIGTTGWFFHERTAQAALLERAEDKAEELATQYVETVRGLEGDLRVASNSEDGTRAALDQLLAVTAEVAAHTQGDILTRLRDVTRVRGAADRLLSVAGERSSADAGLRRLQSALGDRGELAVLIAEYNAMARAWNTRGFSIASSLAASVTGEAPQQLPYLRPDGVQDDVLLIEI